MAINAATKTSNLAGFIRPEIAQAYFAEVQKASVVQSLARQVPLSVSGEAIPVLTEKPTASWVEEGAKKPTTQAGLTMKTMTPKKIAAIAVVSAEVVRANPGNYMEVLRQEIAESFARAFDDAVIHGTSNPFGVGTNLASTSKAVKLGTSPANKGGIFADLNSGLDLLVKDKKKLNGFVFDDVAEPLFNASVDANGRPLFVPEPTVATAAVRSGTVLGRPASFADTVANGTTAGSVVGIGGDFSKALWGTVGGINFDVSTESTVTIGNQLVSLWENNLVAIRAEAEFGWLIESNAHFVKYTL